MDVNELLFNFIRKQEWDKLEKYLSENDDINVNVRDYSGNYLLTYAILFNKIKLTTMLIHKGSKLDIQDSDGRCILYTPIRYGYLELLNLLLHFNKTIIGISLVDIQDKNGDTPLHYAVSLGEMEIIKMLLKAGSNVNFKNNEGFNILHLSIFTRNIDIVKLILNEKININLKSNTGETALHIACNLEQYEIVKLLIENGANVNSRDYDYEYTPILYLVNKNNSKILSLLLKQNADVNSQDYYGNTALHFSIIEQNYEIFIQLTKSDFTKNKINFNLYNAESQLPLHLAFNYELENFVKVLLPKTNLNFKDNNGNSCLHLLIKKEMWEDFKDELKIKKLDVFSKNKNNKRPIDYVKKDKLNDFIKLISNSYLSRLRFKPYTWKNSWENYCKNELIPGKLKDYEKKEIESILKIKGDEDQCLRIIEKKLIDSYTNENYFSSYPIRKDFVKLSINNNTVEFCTFTGVTLDILIGLIYLLEKHKFVCSTLTQDFVENKELCDYYKQIGVLSNSNCEFLNFEIVWVYQKLHLSNNFFQEFDKCVNSSKVRFIIIPLGIELRKGSHANYLIYDKKIKEIERFEPHGSSHPFNFNYNSSLLDNILKNKFELKYGIKYISPSDYLPKIGFQVLDSFESNCIKIGDPKGFCALWSLWYADMRIKHPNLQREILVKEIIRTIKDNNFQFKDIIRNYSKEITEKRDKILSKAGININDWINDKYTGKQMKIIVDEIINEIKKVKN